MIRRLVVCAAAALAVATCSPFAAAQQSDLGEIRIAVTDASTKVPLALARVLLTGPVIASELTGSNGEVLFTDVPDGIYRARVVKNGYEAVTSPQFEVIEGRAITVTVSLAYYQALQVIGHVSVRSSTTVSADTITQDSAQRKLSNDLADALNKLSGVSVSTSSDDSNATQTVSLEGHDASQTQLSLDGIPLNAPGTAGDLRSFGTDLFTGASVHLGPQLGGLGGGVNFTTLEPTLSWLTYASLSMGSYGKYNYSVAETGSAGKLGIAVETTDRYAPTLVDGERYLDASGLDYIHQGNSSFGGELLKLHYAFSDSQTLIGTFLNSTRESGLVCLRLDGTLPCGYGPNNGSQGNFDLYSLTDDALLGATTVQASIFGMSSKNLLNELNRYVGGVLEPNGFSSASQTTGYSINATLPSRERHTIAIQAYGTTTSQSNTPLVPQALPYYTGSAHSSYGTLQLTDTIHSNDRLTLNEAFGISHASYAPSSFLGSAGATWRPNARDTYALSYALGGIAAGGTRQTILTDPASLRFDCNGDVAYGSAPGDQPGSSSSSSLRFGYTHAIAGGSITLSLYRQVQNDVVLPVDVNGSVLTALGIVPPGYPALVQPIWDSPAGCNAAPGTPFGATQLYFRTPISGTRRTYEGGELTSYLTFGNLVVQPFYNLTSAVVFSSDPRIENSYSIVIPGKQLPNVPLQRAGIVFDYKSPGSALEYLFDAQYVGSNNPNDLPAYTTFDAGVSAQLQHGTLTVAASNITNAYSGIFASPQWEVPYVTLGGMTLPNLARPLAPRQYSVTYTVKFGEGAAQVPSGNAFQAPHGGPGGPEGGPRLFLGPGGPGGPGGRGRGGFRNRFSPLPAVPPADPFAVNDNPQTCSASDVAAAQVLSNALKAFQARIEAAKTSAGYPATIAVPQLPDATITYHGLGSTYALTITPKAFARVRMLAGCLTIHLARSEDVTARHLYRPSNALFLVLQLQFMPSVGFYVAMRQQQPGQESFRVYQLPTAPPRVPFEVRTAATCTGDLHNTAVELLGELRAHFANGAATPSWTITAHGARAGTWYEMNPGDPSTLGALLMCGRVASGTAAEVAQHGYDGKAVPELNYTPALGIYMIRPQFRGAPPNGVIITSPSPSPSP
ncbi:MAG TPA: TonB-dependent receptor [Candidatus Tyrphobacter sp.]